MVTDTQTGELMKAVLVRRQKNSSEEKWRIKSDNEYCYFNQQAIRASYMRKEMKARPFEELHKRNNVEASIFQLSFPLRNNKSKYRGLIKQKIWAYCRCLWINLIRILNFTKQTCQRTSKTLKIPALNTFCSGHLALQITINPIWCRKSSMVCIISIIANIYLF